MHETASPESYRTACAMKMTAELTRFPLSYTGSIFMTEKRMFFTQKLKTRYIGDKAFYLAVLAVAVPIMIQNGITNFVSMLDNIMIGRIGTEQMSGASIVNQLIFVYNLCIFGGVSGAGIFTAQFFGQKNEEGIRQTFRFKIWLVFLLTGAAVLLFLAKGEALIGLYLKGKGSDASRTLTLSSGLSYLRVMLTGLPAFMLVQAYAGTLRECNQTMLPMEAGITAVLVNLCFNYLLIYGKMGFPKLGIVGAALATVLSRYVELAIILVWTHTHDREVPFIRGLYKTMKIPGRLVRKVFIKGIPLLLNETMWAAGMAMLAQCYSVRGLDVVAAMNINNTIGNVFSIVFISLGNAVAIIIGQLLGAGKMEEAKDTDNKLIAFSVLSCIVTSAGMLLAAPFFPGIYETTPEVRRLAAAFMRIYALFLPFHAFLNACYFTIRAGGKTIITFLFDSVFIWIVSVTLAFCLTRFTAMRVEMVYVIVTFADFLKCFLGFYLVRKGVWLANIVSN